LSQHNDDFDPEKYRVTTNSGGGKQASAPDDDFDPEQFKVKRLDPSIMKRIPGAASKVAGDVLTGASKIPFAVMKVLINTPKYGKYLRDNAPDAGSQIVNDPARAVRNAAAGLAEHGHELLNMPSGMAKYMNKIGLIEPETAEAVPRQKNITPQLRQFVGEDKQPGDELLRGAFRNANAIISAPSAVGLGIKATNAAVGGAMKGGLKLAQITPGLGQLVGKEDKAIAKKAAALEILTGKEAENALKASQEFNAQEQALQAAKAKAKREVNVADADAMEYKLGEHAKNMEAAKQKSAELDQSLKDIPPPPEPPVPPAEKNIIPPEEKTFAEPQAPEPLSPEHDQKVQAAQEALNAGEENLTKAKEHHENVTQMAKDASNNLGEHLKVGSAHDVHVGEFLKNKYKEVHSYWTDRYKTFVKDVKDKKITMPTPETKAGMVNMSEVIEDARAGKGKAKAGKAKSKPANPVLDDLLKMAPTSADTAASTFLSKFKDFRNERFKLRQAMKFSKSAQERDNIAAALKNSEKVEIAAKKALDEGLGKEHAAEFAKLNEGYSKIVFPLRENRVMKVARKYGLVNGNMINKLRGSEVGQDLVRGMIKQDPEMVKHVVGQTYEVKPSKIHNPNELTREYTEQMPQLQKLIEAKNASEKMVGEAKSHIENHSKAVAQHRQNLTKASNEGIRARREQAAKEKAYNTQLSEHKRNITKHEKAKAKYEKDVAAHEKEKQDYHSNVEAHANQTKAHADKIRKAEKAIVEHQDKIKKMQDRARLIEENMNNVRKEANKSGIKLEQKMKAEQKHSDLKKQLSEMNKKVDDTSSGLMHLYRMARTLYKVTKGF
jgi:hypothetical protein